MRILSKSKLMAFRQCPKRLWLEVYHPELRKDSAATQASFAAGYQVGDIARQLYDPKGEGVLIDPQAEGFDAAFARTQLLLQSPQPIFEAGFRAQGALAFADAILPVEQGDQLAWRMVEVKSSTSVKGYHHDDSAVQSYIARASNVPLIGIALAHIDSSDTLETALLAIELLRRIPRGRKITAAELHSQLKDAGIERELRTIQRQLEMLSEHFEIERDDRSKPYGYRWLERAKGLALPNLTPQESLLLGLAEEHLRNLLPSRLMNSMEGFFAQARRNLGPDSNAKLEREWPKKVRVVAATQPLLPPKIIPGVFETVSDALYSNRWLKLNYKNSSGKQSEVGVMPLGLAQQGARLYLVCRYAGYDNERSLALNRIISAEATTQTFKRPLEFDLKKYDDDGRFGFGKGQRIQLKFLIKKYAGLHLLESPLSADQQVIERDDGYFEITATVVESLILDKWLLGFGDEIVKVERNQIV